MHTCIPSVYITSLYALTACRRPRYRYHGQTSSGYSLKFKKKNIKKQRNMPCLTCFNRSFVKRSNIEMLTSFVMS